MTWAAQGPSEGRPEDRVEAIQRWRNKQDGMTAWPGPRNTSNLPYCAILKARHGERFVLNNLQHHGWVDDSIFNNDADEYEQKVAA